MFSAYLIPSRAKHVESNLVVLMGQKRKQNAPRQSKPHIHTHKPKTDSDQWRASIYVTPRVWPNS